MANILLIIGNDPANRLYIGDDILSRYSADMLGTCVGGGKSGGVVISSECKIGAIVIGGLSLDANSPAQSHWVLSGAAGVKPAEAYVIQVANLDAARALLSELPAIAVRDRLVLFIEDGTQPKHAISETSCLLLILGSNTSRLALDANRLRSFAGLAPLAVCATGQNTWRALYGETAGPDGSKRSLAVLSNDPVARATEAYVLHFDGRANALMFLANQVNGAALDGRTWLLMDNALA